VHRINDDIERHVSNQSEETGLSVDRTIGEPSADISDRTFSRDQISTPVDPEPLGTSARSVERIRGYLDAIGSHLETADPDRFDRMGNPPIHQDDSIRSDRGIDPDTRHHNITPGNNDPGTDIRGGESDRPSLTGPEIRDLQLSIGSIRVVVEASPEEGGATDIRRNRNGYPAHQRVRSTETNESGRLNRHYIR